MERTYNGPWATVKLEELARLHATEVVASVVLSDQRFAFWSGSSKPELHHYGDGGLAQHTYEVVEIGLAQLPYFNRLNGLRVDPKLYFLAALFHDAGKMWDYRKIPDCDVACWTSAEHKYMIHHIARSAVVWTQATATCDHHLTSGQQDEVLHAILAHHGRREWGSPVSPQTGLAWLLHTADMMSARMNDLGAVSRKGG